jgi:hypothetical protein
MATSNDNRPLNYLGHPCSIAKLLTRLDDEVVQGLRGDEPLWMAQRLAASTEQLLDRTLYVHTVCNRLQEIAAELDDTEAEALAAVLTEYALGTVNGAWEHAHHVAMALVPYELQDTANDPNGKTAAFLAGRDLACKMLRNAKQSDGKVSIEARHREGRPKALWVLPYLVMLRTRPELLEGFAAVLSDYLSDAGGTDVEAFERLTAEDIFGTQAEVAHG